MRYIQDVLRVKGYLIHDLILILEITSQPKKIIEVSDELKFDSETMESLGLIINELVTNSYKYAFKPDADNILNLSINGITSLG